MQLSIVIPLFNEADSLKELAGWITDVMQKNAISYELLFIDDGSTDDSWNTIEQICAENPRLRPLGSPRILANLKPFMLVLNLPKDA